MPAPTEQLAAARAVLTQAQPTAANDAPLELFGAQEKLRRAEQAMLSGDYLHARIFAEQAEVDAKYASSVAENARAQRAVAQIDKSIEVLRNEVERRER
jgi:Domain of unknown function (DUF4398)